MQSIEVRKLLLENFPYEPTIGQDILLSQLSDFIISNDEKSLFLLRGYAGTGKTTIVSSLVKVLPLIKKRSVLLAPTGRAAKVLSSYSGKRAHTVHRKIYFAVTSKEGNIVLTLTKNKHKDTIFIVDEASMITDSIASPGALFTGRSLLDDLIQYVYTGENCKILFIGDNAQLPPVGLTISPALDVKYLKTSYNLNIEEFELTEVVRQAQQSGILMNATNVREKIKYQNTDFPYFSVEPYKDIIKLMGVDSEDALNDAYSSGGLENSVVITRSNKRANQYNQEIRRRILYRENEIEAGDFLMIVKNNYFWLPEDSKAGFMANGDIVELLRISKIEELYGFRFADVTIRMIDYPDEDEREVKIILDTISADAPALKQADNNRLYNEVLQDYMDLPSRFLRSQKMKIDPYFNALQVKFAYALTCHKTQGGQWNTVFVDQGWLTDEMINVEYMRWLYTALTRATDKLYLVNFKEEFYHFT
ncbi:MAG: AAA family ATPase [Saprospiraceae bacterium]|nr:AAA family ATPase [Saprospiraceae bacterium]